MLAITPSSYSSCVAYRARVSASAAIATIRRSSPSTAIARTVPSSVCPCRTLGLTGSSGLRLSAITAHIRATASVLSQASGRSANSARIARAGLNQCSGVTRRRPCSLTCRPSAMHNSASCASCIDRVAKKHSLVATSGNRSSSANEISAGSTAFSIANPCRCSSIMQRPGNASAICASSASASGLRPSASSRAIGPRIPPVSRISPDACCRIRSSPNCGRAGSDSMNPYDDSACRLASPTASWASSTTGSGTSAVPPGTRDPALSVRARLIWHPTMGCTPLPTQYWLNSSAPNRLPLSAIATAGCLSARASAAMSPGLIAPSLSE